MDVTVTQLLLLDVVKGINISGGLTLELEYFGDVRVDWEQNCHEDVHHNAIHENTQNVEVLSEIKDGFHNEAANYAIYEVFKVG